MIWCNNISALSLVANLVFHSKGKHVELDLHFVRDKVLAKQLDVRYIPTNQQLAYGLTKSLTKFKFCELQSKPNVCSSPMSLGGGCSLSSLTEVSFVIFSSYLFIILYYF